MFKRKPRKHDCWPPTGVVYDPTWVCPVCGDKWSLIEKALVSEWVREETDGEG